MKIWMLPVLLVLGWLPLRGINKYAFYEPVPDVHVFESEDGMAIAVITPDPFGVDEGPDKAWRVEMHVRGPRRSTMHEAFFHSASITRRTVAFEDARLGYEVQVREQRAAGADQPAQVRRWRFAEEDVREIIVPHAIDVVTSPPTSPSLRASVSEENRP